MTPANQPAIFHHSSAAVVSFDCLADMGAVDAAPAFSGMVVDRATIMRRFTTATGRAMLAKEYAKTGHALAPVYMQDVLVELKAIREDFEVLMRAVEGK